MALLKILTTQLIKLGKKNPPKVLSSGFINVLIQFSFWKISSNHQKVSPLKKSDGILLMAGILDFSRLQNERFSKHFQ